VLAPPRRVMTEPLPHLNVIALDFECLREPPPAARVPGKLLEVLYANLKEAGLPEGAPCAFHLRDLAAPTTLWPAAGRHYASELVVRAADQATWDQFATSLKSCGFRGNFGVHLGEVSALDTDASAPSEVPGELCLDFLTPLRFGRAQDAPPTALTPPVFIDLIERRMTKLCGQPWRFDPVPDITLLTHCWHYHEYWRRSASHARHPTGERSGSGLHYLKGCVGPLYLRGELARLLPVLRLLSHAHLARGGGAQSLSGHFVLHERSRAFFDRWLLRGERVEALIDEYADRLAKDDGWVRASRNDGDDSRRHAAHLVEELGACRYAPQPAQVWRTPRTSGGSREIELAAAPDALVQQHLLRVLQPTLDGLHSDSAHGFRPGRSVETVVRRVHAALKAGLTHVLRADISAFFASVDHAVLGERLDQAVPQADRATRHALQALLATPRRLPGHPPVVRTTGLAEGSPLSPLLSNLYLRPLDRAMVSADWCYLRYADDFVVLARSAEARDAAQARAADVLASLRLELSAAKTTCGRLDDGFTFVGERFGGAHVEDPARTIVQQRKPLVVLEPFTHLGVNGDALEQRREGRTLQTLPLRRVSEMTVLAPASLSTDLLARLARFRIPLAVALDSGYQVATLAPQSRAFFVIARKHGVWFDALSDADRTALAIRLVDRKIGNYLTWIGGRRRAGDAAVAAQLEQARNHLQSAVDAASARGYEGDAARRVFRWLNGRIRADLRQHFVAPKRIQRAPDRLNTLLSFGYYLLFSRINALLRSHGLNPYLGLLHDGEDSYETLVADLQEPFRVHVDRCVLRFINRGEIGPSEFDRSGERLWLARPAARRFAQAFETMLSESPGGLCIRDALWVQVRSLRATVTQGAPLWLYPWEPGHPATNVDSPARDEGQDDAQSLRC
jgi:CRISPR-associated endonuclease Cas1